MEATDFDKQIKDVLNNFNSSVGQLTDMISASSQKQKKVRFNGRDLLVREVSGSIIVEGLKLDEFEKLLNND